LQSPGSLGPVLTLGGRPEPSYFSCYLRRALTGAIAFVLLVLLLALLAQLLVFRALSGVENGVDLFVGLIAQRLYLRRELTLTAKATTAAIGARAVGTLSIGALATAWRTLEPILLPERLHLSALVGQNGADSCLLIGAQLKVLRHRRNATIDALLRIELTAAFPSLLPLLRNVLSL